MRAIWTGTIGFGLVNIPVKLYSAIQPGELDLDMLDKSDHANIQFKRVNANTGKEVPWKNIVKGFKIDDRYVVLTDQDFEKASPEKTKIIDVDEFVKEAEIDSLYYDSSYYMEPEQSGARAYTLFREALKETSKVAIGSFVLRTKQSVCIIKPYGDILVLQKIRFKEEIRKPEDLNIPKSSAKPAEMKMAIQLINQLTNRFDISKYKDSYTADLMKLIKAKASGKNPKAPHLKVVHSKTKDLMSQLKASLGTKSRKAS